MPNEMIEQVAKALQARSAALYNTLNPPPIYGPWDGLSECDKEAYCKYARAAIAAMRDYTHKMHSAGDEKFFHLADEPHPGEVSGCGAIWDAMIDAALREEADSP